MNHVIHILFLGFMIYVRSAENRPETVWLKEVTTKFQTDKRTLGDPNLPDQLTFHIRRESNDLTLNLKRNYDIDPNADIYVFQTINDGQSVLTKDSNLEREDVAYYQDVDNGAYMTVRCVKRSNQQCERVVNGNFQIEDNSYHLQPVVPIDSSNNLNGFSDLTGKRYIMLHQDNIQLETVIDNKDNTRQLHRDYYVKIAVLIDASIWTLYSSRDKNTDPLLKSIAVKKRIREAFSHIINGVNFRYKSIEDRHLSIRIILHSFTFFETACSFPRVRSKVLSMEGKTRVEAYNYLYDIGDWANKTNELQPGSYDHVMLFTRHDLFDRTKKTFVNGMSIMNGVCEVMSQVSVVSVSHYTQAVRTATHELGHNLGAVHDGEEEARACKATDSFIMTSSQGKLSSTLKYIDNNFKFSICSIESFRTKLKNKDCLKTPGPVFNMAEWTKFMTKEAGDVFTPNELCYFVYGPGSKFTGEVSKEICYLSHCKDPATRIQMKAYLNAARGTKCGDNKWCIDGRCVPKDSN